VERLPSTHTLSGFNIVLELPGPAVMDVPVHSGSGSVVNLHAVHADIPISIIQILRNDLWKCEKRTAVFRPAFTYRKFRKIGVVNHDILT
jgi:hypothetical protein